MTPELIKIGNDRLMRLVDYIETKGFDAESFPDWPGPMFEHDAVDYYAMTIEQYIQCFPYKHGGQPRADHLRVVVSNIRAFVEQRHF